MTFTCTNDRMTQWPNNTMTIPTLAVIAGSPVIILSLEYETGRRSNLHLIPPFIAIRLRRTPEADEEAIYMSTFVWIPRFSGDCRVCRIIFKTFKDAASSQWQGVCRLNLWAKEAQPTVSMPLSHTSLVWSWKWASCFNGRSIYAYVIDKARIITSVSLQLFPSLRDLSGGAGKVATDIIQCFVIVPVKIPTVLICVVIYHCNQCVITAIEGMWRINPHALIDNIANPTIIT